MRHSQWFRSGSKRYIEPFLGGGAVFFHIRPRWSLLNDLNAELISTYITLRDQPSDVRRHLMIHQRNHCYSYYYYIRNQSPRNPATRAARFIYLNRTCFNGIYRVNKQGNFNVPIGSREMVISPADDFEAVSKMLKLSVLTTFDFSSSIDNSGDGDFIYVDPPYTVRHNNNNFLKYNERIFSWSDQKRPADCLQQASQRGAGILISNADHQSIRELYRARRWKIHSVERLSRIASSPKYRKPTTELVISNYLNHRGEQVDIRH